MLRLDHRSPKPFSKIDATRLVFAMLGPVLVLLCIFMSYPTVMCKCAGVDLARADHASAMATALKDDAMYISVTRDGSLFFGSNKVTPDQLVMPIRLAVSRGAERKIYMNVDARARYGNVAIVLQRVFAAYVEQVAFLTQPSVAPPAR